MQHEISVDERANPKHAKWNEAEQREPTPAEMREFQRAFSGDDDYPCARVTRVQADQQRCVTLATQRELGVAEWIELTGVGLGQHRMFRVDVTGVHFKQWQESDIAEYPPAWQGDMLRENQTPPLLFPCSPIELLEFVGRPPAIHYFPIPDAFRAAASNALSPKEPQDDKHVERPIEEPTVDEETFLVTPALKEGPNKRAAVKAWVQSVAHELLREGDMTDALADRILAVAQRHGYESERVPICKKMVLRMLPGGLTGGRGRRSTKTRRS